jgi:hypothetical protein
MALNRLNERELREILTSKFPAEKPKIGEHRGTWGLDIRKTPKNARLVWKTGGKDDAAEAVWEGGAAARKMEMVT